MTKYRLVQCIAGRMIVSEFDEQNILPAMVGHSREARKPPYYAGMALSD
jgi:hypothetical protein